MSRPTAGIASLGSALFATARRDLLLAWKRPGDVLNPVFFFLMVCTLFPLAVGPSKEQLAFSGPGVLWVAALLSTLLSLNSLFLSDLEDGSLEQLLVSAQPLTVTALGKTLAHWLTSGVPLVVISPVVAITYRMPVQVIEVLMLTLVLGTIILSLLGAIGAALTVGLHRGTALLSLLVLPLAMPVLILGANTVSLAASNELYTPGLWALGAYAMGAVSLAPFAAAAALRITNE
ncbi:MAG: heme exporter protein CcmB [Woeseiaceae bacterium]|jgi:heme exporter protein B|nr:heme exporter protein CcmB [Woeseiaceae bacterium]